MTMVKQQKDKEAQEQDEFHDEIFKAMRAHAAERGAGSALLNPAGLQDFYHDFQTSRHRSTTLPFLDKWAESFTAALPGPDDTAELQALQEAIEEEEEGARTGGIDDGEAMADDGAGTHAEP